MSHALIDSTSNGMNEIGEFFSEEVDDLEQELDIDDYRNSAGKTNLCSENDCGKIKHK